MQKRRSRKNNIAVVGDEASFSLTCENDASSNEKTDKTEENDNTKKKISGNMKMLDFHLFFLKADVDILFSGYRKFSLQSRYLDKSNYPYGIFKLVSTSVYFSKKKYCAAFKKNIFCR